MATDNGTVDRHACGGKHLWIVNHHAVLPSKDGGTARHMHLARELQSHGWTASLVVASTKHPSGDQGLGGFRLRKLSDEQGVPALWIRTNSYTGSLPLRFLGMAVFAMNLLRPGATRGLRPPDIVLGSTVHPLAAWAAYRLAKRMGVPFIYEIRDVWPETLYDVAQISERHPVARFLARIDQLLIWRSALVVSPLPHVDRHLVESGFSNKPFLWVSNGSEPPAEVDSVPERPRVGAPFTFMYLGAHGRANALDDLIRAFDIAYRQCPDRALSLRLVGDGPLKKELIDLASSLPSGPGISFEDRIPKSEVGKRAREADCLVANVADRSVYRFGVSLNKFFVYLSAGLPVITASSAPNDPVRESGAGFNVPGGDIYALAGAMVEMSGLSPGQRAAMGKRAVSELRQKYTFDKLAGHLAKGLDQVIDGLIANGSGSVGGSC